MPRLLILLFALSACSGPSQECSESSLISVFVDEDRDGFGDSAQQKLVCEVGPKHASVGGDCDDTRAGVYPDGVEECDGLDNNCDGAVDEGLREHTWFADEDGDGFGRASRTADACSAPPGYVDNDWDCHDDDALSNPAADEFCDGKDNDCDDLVDDEDPSTVTESMPTWYKDNDVDGFGTTDEILKQCSPPANGAWVQNADDCDDAEKLVSPNATEICNEIDDDCDGHIDDSDAGIDPNALSTFWYDGDDDGFGDDSLSVQACDAPWFYVNKGGDCDDTEPHLQDAASGWWVIDSDGDGFGDMNAAPQGPGCNPPAAGYVHQFYAGDCDDAASAIFPGANEICDGLDNNCDGATDDDDDLLDLSTANTYYADADIDGYGDVATPVKACVLPPDASASADDCDDDNAAVNPGATEICNANVDDDCDGLFDSADDTLDLTSVITWYFDFDFDGWGDPLITVDACAQPPGYVGNDRDCDDNDPGGPYMRPWIQDADFDGFGAGPLFGPACAPPGLDWMPADLGIALDCDDTDFDSNPDGTEICGDGIDQDCDGQDEVCTVPDTCAEAQVEPPKTTGVHHLAGNLASYADDINMSSGDYCTLSSSPGEEAILPVKIAPGEVLDAQLTGSTDMMMYLVTTCNSPNISSCEAGGDVAMGANSTENLQYQNNSGAAVSAYLVLDCSGSCGTFTLDFEIYPSQSSLIAPTCGDALADIPLTTGGYIFGGKLTASMGNDMNLSNFGASCTGFSTNGYEVFLPVELQPNELVYFWYVSRDSDGAIYILKDCSDGSSCYVGDDQYMTSPDDEEVKYQNNTGAVQTVYLGLDNFPSSEGRFISRVIIE